MTTRRKFIKQTTSAGLIVCFGIALDSCSSAKYIYLSGDVSKLIVNKSDLEEKNMVILKHEKLSSPVFLSKNENGNFSAVLMLCTHKGCEVRHSGNVLLCPCHNSEFSFVGDVLKSPATENLKKFETTSDEKNVYVFVK